MAKCSTCYILQWSGLFHRYNILSVTALKSSLVNMATDQMTLHTTMIFRRGAESFDFDRLLPIRRLYELRASMMTPASSYRSRFWGPGSHFGAVSHHYTRRVTVVPASFDLTLLESTQQRNPLKGRNHGRVIVSVPAKNKAMEP